MTTTQQMEIQASHLLKCERVSTLGLRTCCADRKNMIQEAKSHRRRRFCMDFACNGSARLNCYGLVNEFFKWYDREKIFHWHHKYIVVGDSNHEGLERKTILFF